MATKKNIKNTKKFVADITVDLTDATCGRDVYVAFADAKMEKYCTGSEIKAFVGEIVDNVRPTFVLCQCQCECHAKKPNIFKRFWNWITRKK